MRVFVAGGSGAIGRRAPWCARCTLSGFHLQVGTSAIGLRIRVHVLGLDSGRRLRRRRHCLLAQWLAGALDRPSVATERTPSRQLTTQTARLQGFSERYWARTSDPKLVRSERPFAPVH